MAYTTYSVVTDGKQYRICCTLFGGEKLFFRDRDEWLAVFNTAQAAKDYIYLNLSIPDGNWKELV